MRSPIRRRTDLDALYTCSARSAQEPCQRLTVARVASALALSLALVACGGGGPSVVAKSMPAGGNFSGVYFSPQYGEMNLIQNGSAVVGEYKQEMRSGKIQGEATGDLLKFEWNEKKAMVSNRAQEARGHGYFRYVVDSSNGDHVLKGEWGLGDDSTGGGPWNAYKAKNKEPHLSNESSSSGGDSSSSDESETPDSSGSSGDDSSGDDLF
jgi:hypothetical protein